MKKNKKKQIGTLDFFCIGFGAIVGVGWAVSINSWMVSCGGPVPAALGYLLVLVMIVPISLCYAKLVPMFPISGGGMSYAYEAFNEKAAMVAGWSSLGGMIAILPWEAIQITDMLGYLIPGIKTGPVLYKCYGTDIYLVVVLIGLFFSVLLYALNMRGLAAAASIQRILCIVLVGTGLIGAAAALLGGNVENLLPLYDVSNPAVYGSTLNTISHVTFFGGCFAIVAQAPYFLAGFETIPQDIEDAGGNIKSIGKMVVLSVVLACAFYAFLLISFGMAWPWQDFAGMERPAAAFLFLYRYPGTAGRLLYWMITIGAIAGLFTTWNGFYTASANMMMSMSRGRLIPGAWAKQNKSGIAYIGQATCLLLSCIGPFLGSNLIDTITSFSAAAFTLSWGLAALSLLSLCRKEMRQGKLSKTSKRNALISLFASVITVAVFVCMFIPVSPFFIGWNSVSIFLIWMLIGGLMFALSAKRRRGLSLEMLEKGLTRNIT